MSMKKKKLPNAYKVPLIVIIALLTYYFDDDFKEQPIEWFGAVVILLVILFYDTIHAFLDKHFLNKGSE